MQYCARCGEQIQGAGLLREIRIGSSSWVSTATDRQGVRFTNSVRFGRRTVCAVCASQLDKWRLLKWLALGSGAVAFATMILASNSTPPSGSRNTSFTAYSPQASLSSPQSQVPPPLERPTLAPSAPQPVAPEDAGGQDRRTFDQQATTLESTLNRLRQSQLQDPQSQPTPTPTPLSTDTGTQQQVWPHRTATGTRWRLQPQQGGYNLLIDLGTGQMATVRVAPQFTSLSLDAMNIRVDQARDVIASQYSLSSGAYVFTRDGVIFPER